MNAVEASVAAGYHPGQNQADNDVGQTKHWTQSRTVRAVAGIAVLALGGLAGLAASFFASTFVAIIAAAAVTVVVGVAVIGYFYHHSGNSMTATASDSHSTQPPASPFPAAQPIQPPPYTATYVPPSPPPPPYSPPSTPAATATAYAPAVSSNTPPSDPPPAYARYGTSASAVADDSDPPPAYIDITSEEFIRMQEASVDYLLEQHGESIYRSSRDGNCMYDSAAHQCPDIARDATDLRHQVACFARNWQQCYPNSNANFSPIEASAYARLQGDVLYETRDGFITNGLEEIESPGCFSDQIDTFFLAQVARRPVIVIDTDNNINIAVDENGRHMDWLETYNPNLVPQRKILLVRDGAHFMGRNLGLT